MKAHMILGVLLLVVATSKAETTVGYQQMIRPIAEGCKSSVNASDRDVESVVHLRKDFTPEGKCLAACVMDKIGMMKDGKIAPVEQVLGPYRVLFADDPNRLGKAEQIVTKCVTEALEKFPDKTCDMAHVAVECTILTSE